MAEWKSLGPETMLADGAMTELEVNNEVLLIARVKGQYYATQGLCRHLGGHLAKGRLEDFIVTCPRHGSQYDIRDGHNVAWIPLIKGLAHTAAVAIKKPQGLRSYPTEIKDGQVWVQLP